MSKDRNWRETLKSLPVIGPALVSVRRVLRSRRAGQGEFPGTVQYWESRYASGGDSGAGSYSRLATFKAEVLNAFVEHHGVASVIEFGCGDGNQLTLARYDRYLGFDVARSAIDRCSRMFRDDPTRTFRLMSEYSGERADLSLSLDVIYHLVEDAVFDAYMRRLFEAAGKFVAIYSSNDAALNERLASAPHVRHRRFSDWIERNAPGWRLLQHIPNRYPYSRADPAGTSCADFYFYARERDA